MKKRGDYKGKYHLESINSFRTRERQSVPVFLSHGSFLQLEFNDTVAHKFLLFIVLTSILIPTISAHKDNKKPDFKECEPSLGDIASAGILGGLAGAQSGRAAGPAGMAVGATAGTMFGLAVESVRQTEKSLDCMEEKINQLKP